MLMQSKSVTWPAQAEIDADLSEFGQLSTKTRAAYGSAAVEAGTPDFGQNDYETDAADAIANILHAVELHGGGIELVIERARMHYEAESRDEL